MTCSAISELVVSAESSEHENFWEYNGAFKKERSERVLFFLGTNG